VSSNTTHGEVFLIQHVMKFVGDLRHVCDFLISFTNKTDCHNITEILLKVALNTLIQYSISLFNRWIFSRLISLVANPCYCSLLISLVANPCYCSLLVSLANGCIFPLPLSLANQRNYYLVISLANQVKLFSSNKSSQPKKLLSSNKSSQPSETFLFQ
jgi:hypothetical protein